MAEDISREALLIYLDDVRTMETIVYESEGKKNKIEEKEKLLTNTYDKTKKDYDSAVSRFDRAASEMKALSSAHRNNIPMLIVVLIIIVPLVLMFLLWDSGIARVLSGFLILVLAITSISSSRKANESAEIKKNEAIEEQDKAEKRKNEMDALAKQAHSEWSEFVEKKNAELPKLLDDISSVKTMLAQAYNANIIPLQFRNIQGVYYLYDYISTSNQGLSEALMQCNLDAIKQKLDQVIELQGKAIIQQAQANAKLFQQNQQILETAQATMQNTYVAAKYAQISAINSELSLKLQQKELAYQTVDFWLK